MPAAISAGSAPEGAQRAQPWGASVWRARKTAPSRPFAARGHVGEGPTVSPARVGRDSRTSWWRAAQRMGTFTGTAA